MKAPMPIDELPSFIAKSNGTVQPGSNPWLKYIIVGGILLVGLIVSASIMRTPVVNNKTTKRKENE